MSAQMLVRFENKSDISATQFQEQTSVNKQMLILLQQEIHEVEQDYKRFERQYMEFVNDHQNLLGRVAV